MISRNLHTFSACLSSTLLFWLPAVRLRSIIVQDRVLLLSDTTLICRCPSPKQTFYLSNETAIRSLSASASEFFSYAIQTHPWKVAYEAHGSPLVSFFYPPDLKPHYEGSLLEVFDVEFLIFLY